MNKVLVILMIVFAVSVQAFCNETAYIVGEGNARKNLINSELTNYNFSLTDNIRQQKYGKMALSPFIFYRGTAHLYYKDLDSQNIIQGNEFYSLDAITWIQGDLHVQNYGAFDDDEKDIVFDLNDFDESWTTSYLYDVLRAAVSIVLVGRENATFSKSQIDNFVDTFSESYLDKLEDYRGNNDEKNEKVTKSNAYGKLDDFLEDVEDDNSRKKMLNKWTNVGSNGRYFDLSYEKLESVSSSDRSLIIAAINSYKDTIQSNLNGDASYFTVLDAAKRVLAGTGSLGTPRYYVLIEGKTSSDDDDRILDVKQQGFPSIYPYLTQSEIDRIAHYAPGDRVIQSQKAMLTDVDDHLGCAEIFGSSYSVRERSPFKESFDTTILNSVTRFTKLAEQWGTILATAHARADDDFDEFIIDNSFEEIMHQLTDHKHDDFRDEVLSFANNYADQVEIDYSLFLDLLNTNDL